MLELLRYVRGHRKYVALTVFFGAAGFSLSFAYPWIVGSVIDVVAPASAMPMGARRARLAWLTALAAAAAVMHAAVVYGRGHFNVHLGNGVVADLRRELFEHLQKLSPRFYSKERTGAVLGSVVHDAPEAMQLIYMGVIVVGLDAVQLVIAVALLAGISWRLTLATLAVFPVYGAVFALLNPRVRAASERMRAELSRIAGNVAEQLSGHAVVKTHTAEAREARRFGDDVRRHHRLVVEQSHQGHLVAASGEVLVHVGTTIVVGYGGWLALQGRMSAGTITRFLGYVLVMYGPVRRFAELNITYQTSLSAIRRVLRVVGIRPSVVEPSRPHPAAPSRGHVRFEGVRFRYADDSDEARVRIEDGADAPRDRGAGDGGWVLDGVSLEALPGERVAIVGPSGAGKTTLLSLLPRLYDATEGRVLVDGVDVRDYSLRGLRSAIGIVQQEPLLFSGTVRDNIAYGRPEASRDEVVEAARAACAHEFIARLPGGYGALLGERGANLSGGQRQRIAIARALLKDPRILLLDEATNSLDAASEDAIQRALERAMRSRTCLVVAHRLSTVRGADRIYVLWGDRVAESGTHGELMARGGLYAGLVRKQGG